MRAKLGDDRGITLVVVLLTTTILLSVIGAGLLFSGINSKISVNYKTGARAFYAADGGISQGIGQLTADVTTATAAFGPIDVGNGLSYRSGGRTAVTPQPMQFVGTRPASGFTLNTGTGYNASGYTFYQYQMNVTGFYKVGGVEVGAREVEAQATFGPVAQ